MALHAQSLRFLLGNEVYSWCLLVCHFQAQSGTRYNVSTCCSSFNRSLLLPIVDSVSIGCSGRSGLLSSTVHQSRHLLSCSSRLPFDRSIVICCWKQTKRSRRAFPLRFYHLHNPNTKHALTKTTRLTKTQYSKTSFISKWGWNLRWSKWQRIKKFNQSSVIDYLWNIEAALAIPSHSGLTLEKCMLHWRNVYEQRPILGDPWMQVLMRMTRIDKSFVDLLVVQRLWPRKGIEAWQ